MTSPYVYLGSAVFPKTLPDLRLVYDDLGCPGPRTISRALGVHEHTVQRWLSTARTPRPYHLALFLCSRYALHERECRLDEAARLHAALYECARRELKAAQQTINRLAELARLGAANEPVSPGGVLMGVSPFGRPGSMASPRSPAGGSSPFG